MLSLTYAEKTAWGKSELSLLLWQFLASGTISIIGDIVWASHALLPDSELNLAWLVKKTAEQFFHHYYSDVEPIMPGTQP